MKLQQFLKQTIKLFTLVHIRNTDYRINREKNQNKKNGVEER